MGNADLSDGCFGEALSNLWSLTINLMVASHVALDAVPTDARSSLKASLASSCQKIELQAEGILVDFAARKLDKCSLLESEIAEKLWLQDRSSDSQQGNISQEICAANISQYSIQW